MTRVFFRRGLLAAAVVFPLAAAADHQGPQKIVAGRYVVALLPAPRDGTMDLRFIFRDARTGRNLEGPVALHFTVRPEGGGTLFDSGRIAADRGIGGASYAFPRGGLYEVALEFEAGGEVHRPAPWPLWVPGAEAGLRYPMGGSEISGLGLLGLSVVLVFLNLWQRKKGRIWDMPLDGRLSRLSFHAGLMGFALGLGVVLGFMMRSSPWARPAAPLEDHAHGQVEVGPGDPAPWLRLDVQEDSMGGWNVRLLAENFRFAPENVGGPHVPGEGHAHLYVDGGKIGRVYGEWHYLSTLPPGRHEVRATLNANTHAAYAVDGRPVEAAATLVVPQKG